VTTIFILCGDGFMDFIHNTKTAESVLRDSVSKLTILA
jgi:hypothetical protein